MNISPLAWSAVTADVFRANRILNELPSYEYRSTCLHLAASIHHLVGECYRATFEQSELTDAEGKENFQKLAQVLGSVDETIERMSEMLDELASTTPTHIVAFERFRLTTGLAASKLAVTGNSNELDEALRIFCNILDVLNVEELEALIPLLWGYLNTTAPDAMEVNRARSGSWLNRMHEPKHTAGDCFGYQVIADGLGADRTSGYEIRALQMGMLARIARQRDDEDMPQGVRELLAVLAGNYSLDTDTVSSSPTGDPELDEKWRQILADMEAGSMQGGNDG